MSARHLPCRNADWSVWIGGKPEEKPRVNRDEGCCKKKTGIGILLLCLKFMLFDAKKKVHAVWNPEFHSAVWFVLR